MKRDNGIVRSFGLFIVLISCAVCAFASDPLPQPVARLALYEVHPSGHSESAWASVAFSSETTIAVGLCREDPGKECSLVLVRWEGETLRLLARTSRFDSGLSIHPASDGQILAGNPWLPAVLYSADLSTTRDLPTLWHVSGSGKTVAETARGYWRLYRLTDRLEPLREGTGDLQSISDEAVLTQDGKAIKIETLDGKPLGTFAVSDEVQGFHAALLGNNKLYLPDCRTTVRVADFEGKTQLKIHQPGLCAVGDTASSADGRRLLFDVNDHKASGLRHVLESIQTITTLGMVGPEDFNREDVRVLDSATGRTCFDWHHTFPATYSQMRSAAISPSGEAVAIVAEGKLSIYRLPAVCEGATVTPSK